MHMQEPDKPAQRTHLMTRPQQLTVWEIKQVAGSR